MQNNVFTVGVTGGIGSGKSLVCKIFEAFNIPVYYADFRAKWLQLHNAELIDAIKEHFGAQAYHADGTLNRIFLAEQVFTHEDRLALLNSLVHPRVAEDFTQWQQEQAAAPFVLKEAALLFETGSYKSLHKIINVNAPVELRTRRVMMRDVHRSKEQIQAIIAKQWSDGQRSALADFNLTNDERSLIVPEIVKLHAKLLAGRL
jgi:dephospho-CoA kinase